MIFEKIGKHTDTTNLSQFVIPHCLPINCVLGFSVDQYIHGIVGLNKMSVVTLLLNVVVMFF